MAIMMWPSPKDCQPVEPLVVAVAGEAGSGKSTLGRAVAAAVGAPMLDLDSITNPLLDRLSADVFGGHWLAAPHADAIREGRYAALRAVTRDTLSTAGRAVLVAPFTAELRGGTEWHLLREASGTADLRMVHIDGDAGLFAARRAGRSAERDQHRTPRPPLPPAVPVIAVDGELTTGQQLRRVLVALGHRTAIGTTNALLSRVFDAVLIDLDGTLADSTASVRRSWRLFAAETGIPAQAVTGHHTRPARDLLDILLPPGRAEEGLARLTDIEVADATSVRAAPGALAFILGAPAHRRAIVTSGPVRLATARIQAAGLPMPPVLVTADDVRHGKPDPEPYRAAAERLGADPRRCLAVEDTAAGIRSAHAAGCAVVAVTGTVPAEDLEDADLIIDGLDRIQVEAHNDTFRLRVTETGADRSG
jgi:sugar-phosphatase